MDILDIDEALKDDSFIFLEDKTHDDVSNILQQWKSNNCMPQLQIQQQQQQQQEQAYKLNSRTFTRPKRKLAQNLESQFSNSSQYNSQQCNGSPVLNLEIGGLVTTMQKSFLQDTSPPSSICSSMDVSMDRMNNSLITSADFTNVNFLQSTNGLDFNDSIGSVFNFTNKVTNDGYTLSDMIRDRKALESLTMSGDGTLIKDCNIAQIDDISLALSKTASGCSTMDNSTESVETNNRTVEIVNKDRTYEHVPQPPKVDVGNSVGVMHKTMVLSDEMIGDTTFNLVENSIYSELQTPENGVVEPVLGITQDIISENKSANQTFKKPIALDETVCVSGKGNTTFDCQEHTPDARCETPESINKNVSAMKFYESTPQTSSIRYNKQQYTPSIKIADDVNISPIVAQTQLNATRVLNETFERDQQQKAAQVNSDTFSGALPNFDTMEMIENIENPNGTYSKTFSRLEQTKADDAAMQSVMDLAQAEAELLAGNEDEEEFEHMLDELSKVELNSEQLKMKKSLDSIKKRFTYGMAEKHDRELSREAKDMREMMNNSTELLGDEQEETRPNTTMDIRGNEIKKLRDSMRESRELKTSYIKNSMGNSSHLRESMLESKEFMKELRDSSQNGLTSSTMSSASGNSSGERLLSRRSRLYDDINLSALSAQSKSPAASFTVHKNESEIEEALETEPHAGVTEKTEECINDKTMDINSEVQAENMQSVASESEKNAYRLAEKRERDRDRFKTIKIVKQRTVDGEENGERLNVPCIDDMLDQCETTTNDPTEMPQQAQRFSRRDHNSPPASDNVFNNNKEEVENDKQPTVNTNYLTYKKPKEKMVKRSLAEVIQPPEDTSAPAAAPTTTKSRPEPRSLSRPRYISGLQKFSVVSKATSAGDLEKTSGTSASKQLNSTFNSAQSTSASNSNEATSNFNITQPIIGSDNGTNELKSPMGIKSKSFHNLSTNIGYASGASGMQKGNSYGLKKASNSSGILTEKQAKVNPIRTNQGANLNRTTNQVQQSQQKSEDAVFKVPKLVSGIRVPGAAGIKRAGLVRPSSGYYSLNVATTAKNLSQTADVDSDAGRHSPTDSMSSASSRSSVQSAGSGLKPLSSAPTAAPTTDCQLPMTLTKITTGATGIPKPSGLRPPSNIKRSGLPRPASVVRR